MNSPSQLLNTHGYYCSTVHGYSMYPLLFDHKDSVYIEKAKEFRKYDVVLFKRKSGQLVLHRIVGFEGDTLLICGDNEFKIEKVNKEQVLGKMTEFSRKNKEYTVNNFWYKLYYRVWCFSFPTKRVLRKIYTVINRNKNNYG